jgi:hypothetical protein
MPRIVGGIYLGRGDLETAYFGTQKHQCDKGRETTALINRIVIRNVSAATNFDCSSKQL